MDNEIVYSSKATDQKAQYDASAKRLLGQKIILAHILIRVVEEFKGMNADTVASLIEGEPYISQVPVELGLTNKETMDARTGERIVGLNTESSEIDEGKIYFDIIFYVRMRDGLAKMIINLEAQKNEPTKYHILNRAIFYTARLVSSQKEREFTGSDYNEIKQVYSIWICMNMEKNSLSHIHMVKDDLVEEQDWKGNLDILNIVMIGLAKEIPPKEEKYELLIVDQKYKILYSSRNTISDEFVRKHVISRIEQFVPEGYIDKDSYQLRHMLILRGKVLQKDQTYYVYIRKEVQSGIEFMRGTVLYLCLAVMLCLAGEVHLVPGGRLRKAW